MLANQRFRNVSSVFADLQLVSVLELSGLDPLPVHERAVQAALVLREEAAVTFDDHCVLARDRDVVEKDAAVGRTADRRFALWMEGLPRPAAAGADDERGARDAQVLERFRGRVVTLVRRERLRRLGAAFVLHEERTATGAVVRSFGILEAAFLTVDVAHWCSCR